MYIVTKVARKWNESRFFTQSELITIADADRIQSNQGGVFIMSNAHKKNDWYEVAKIIASAIVDLSELKPTVKSAWEASLHSIVDVIRLENAASKNRSPVSSAGLLF